MEQKNAELFRKNSLHQKEKTSLFSVFRESDGLPTTVAGQGNLGQTKGKDILVYGRRPMERQRLGRKLKNVLGHVRKTLRRTGSFC